MNAGIADAANLAWLLAAHLNGWAPRSILDAYEAERLPITDQVSRFAMSHAEAEIRRRGAIPDAIEDASLEGEQARAEVGRVAYAINVQQYACAGLNFGSYYDRSPIIAYDGAPCPPYTMATYQASTVPGCRTPHLWLANKTSLYDALGPSSRCCGWISPSTQARWSRQRNAAACRLTCWTSWRPTRRASTIINWCCRGRTSTSPGAATPCRMTRSP